MRADLAEIVSKLSLNELAELRTLLDYRANKKTEFMPSAKELFLWEAASESLSAANCGTTTSFYNFLFLGKHSFGRAKYKEVIKFSEHFIEEAASISGKLQLLERKVLLTKCFSCLIDYMIRSNIPTSMHSLLRITPKCMRTAVDLSFPGYVSMGILAAALGIGNKRIIAGAGVFS